MSRRVFVAGVVYVVAMVCLGGVAAWPVYESPTAVLVAATAGAVGIGIAAVTRRLDWNWPRATAALVGAWLVLGFAVAIPARWASGEVFPGGLVDVLAGPITGFKDLVTAPLPVGEYRNLLVPFLVVVLACAFGAARLSWRPGATAALAVPVAAVMPLFGLLFGRTATSSPLVLGSVVLSAPVEMATGIAALLASALWLALRARDSRRAALRRAEDATGVQANAAVPGTALRRGALAAGMVAVAVAAGALVAPAIAEPRPREVLRSAVGPDLSKLLAVSPLAEYRNDFVDDRFDQTLFTVTADGKLPERIRLATMTDYDGEVYRVAGDDGAGRFQRVPSRLPVGPGQTRTATFAIEGLRGSWLPTFGALEQLRFTSGDSVKLADGFYYAPETGTAIESVGVAAGDTYEVTAAEPTPSSLGAAGSPGDEPTQRAPKSLVTWLDGVGAGATGAGLQTAIDALRERGYLSHALSLDGEQTPKWMAGLGDYTFRPSTAGHSLARVDHLFQQLLDRQAQAELAGPDASLVGGIGDDEQFAVAGALIADQLGFPSRVVLGFRTDSATLPSCDEGDCRAGDLSAWIEVQTAAGEWIPVDTTPQHEDLPTIDTQRERDPENVTDVRPDTAREVAPPDPQRQEAVDLPPQPPESADLTALWAVVRIVGGSLLALLIVLSPFLLILFAKARRRKARRTAAHPVTQIAGGWEEYVDSAVDAGLPVPGTRTRSEVAERYATPRGADLATIADHAVFSDGEVAAEQSTQFWDVLLAERSALQADRGWWKRLRSALSLKSFTRHLAARTTPDARSPERVASRGGSAAPAARR